MEKGEKRRHWRVHIDYGNLHFIVVPWTRQRAIAQEAARALSAFIERSGIEAKATLDTTLK